MWAPDVALPVSHKLPVHTSPVGYGWRKTANLEQKPVDYEEWGTPTNGKKKGKYPMGCRAREGGDSGLLVRMWAGSNRTASGTNEIWICGLARDSDSE